MLHTPKIGAFVLESLTTGMYPNPLDALRELVQNASDSIGEAERTELIAGGSGRIQVNIATERRSLTVRDTGTGIASGAAQQYLLNVGMSPKQIGTAAGFRGIGRLAAIAYCSRLTFRTTATGESVTTVLSLDCQGIRRSISPALRDPALRNVAELTSVLIENTTIKQESADKKDHWFEVSLEGIGENAGVFLDSAAIEQYLSQVAPVDFDDQRFPYAAKIRKWAEAHGVAIPTVTLQVKCPPNREYQVFKHYKSHYKPSQGDQHFHINDVDFFTVDGGPAGAFWVWYGKNSDFPGMIEDEDCRGLRLRKQNIGLGGPDRVAELFEQIAKSYGRCNYYFIGEVHVLDPRAIPNARRDGFEQEGRWPKIAAALRPFVEARKADVYQGSKVRNQSTERVIRQIEKAKTLVSSRLENGLMSRQEREELVEKIEAAKEKAEEAVTNGRPTEDRTKIEHALSRLAPLETKLREAPPFVGSKLRSSLDRKQRRVLEDVLDIVYATLSGTDCAKRQSCADAIKRAVMTKFGTDGRGEKM